jgi:hypothetical protein
MLIFSAVVIGSLLLQVVGILPAKIAIASGGGNGSAVCGS